MKMTDIHPSDRPREKLEKYGPGKLSNSELLAILLRTGRKGMNAVELARSILGTWSGRGLADVTVSDLKKTAGLGSAKACEIVACFELGKRLLKDKKAALLMSPEDVWKELKDIRDNLKEHHVVLYLDSRRQEIIHEVVAVGTLTANLVHPRETFEPAILHHAAEIIIAHNHPSGDPEPSENDIRVTVRLREAGKILGIELLDHVIVTKKNFVSLRERGLLDG
ncbi:MAG: DNA repair protein RadC [Patescibacteria group bacterium]